MPGELVGGKAVLASQVLHAHQPAFDFLQGFRIEVEVVANPLQQGKRLVELDGSRIEHRVHVLQLRLVGGFALQAGAVKFGVRGDRKVVDIVAS